MYLFFIALSTIVILRQCMHWCSINIYWTNKWIILSWVEERPSLAHIPIFSSFLWWFILSAWEIICLYLCLPRTFLPYKAQLTHSLPQLLSSLTPQAQLAHSLPQLLSSGSWSCSILFVSFHMLPWISIICSISFLFYTINSLRKE